MTYRIQMRAIFSNDDANALLNHAESVKTLVYDPTHYTEVPIIRKTEKCQYVSDESQPTVYSSVDFDTAEITHSGVPTGETNLDVQLDISFEVQQDYYDLLNHIETIKANASSSYIRSCRHFICRHEEAPLTKDGAYSYIDFDGPVLTYP